MPRSPDRSRGGRSEKVPRASLVRWRGRCGFVTSYCIAALAFAALEYWAMGAPVFVQSPKLFKTQLLFALLAAVAATFYFAGVFPPSCRLKVHFPKLPSLRGAMAASVHQPAFWILFNSISLGFLWAFRRSAALERRRKGIALRIARDTLVAVGYALDVGFGSAVVASHLLNPEKQRERLIARVRAARPGVHVVQSEIPIGCFDRLLLALASGVWPWNFPKTAASLRFAC